MRNRIRPVGSLVVGLALLGCAGSFGGVTTAAPRSTPACDSLVAAIAAGTAHPVIRGPSPLQIHVPPPAPGDLHRKPFTVTWKVSASGSATVDSSTVPATTDTRYRARLLHALGEYKFRPASAEGCAVPAVYQSTFDLQ